MDSLKGQLLIASPALLDPNFRRSVVLIVEHGDEGAMGLVLNRPSETEVAEAVPQLEELVEDDDPVYVGGPVDQDAVIALAEFEDPEDAAAIVFGDVGFVASEEGAEPAEAGTRRARVFAGYAGWSAGQLEAELAEEAWIVEPPEREEVFGVPAEELWSAVLRRKGGHFALLARMPPDPSVN